MYFIKQSILVFICISFTFVYGQPNSNSFTIPIVHGQAKSFDPPSDFSCHPNNQAANDFCSNYCQTVNRNMVSGRCGNDPTTCICLTSDNKEITVRLIESRAPVASTMTPPLPPPQAPQQPQQQYINQMQQPPQNMGMPVLLDCDGTTMSTHICDTFCKSIYADYGFCNQTDRNCICFGVPMSVAQPVPIPVVYDRPIEMPQARDPAMSPVTVQAPTPQFYNLPQNYYMQPYQPGIQQQFPPIPIQQQQAQFQQQQEPPTILQPQQPSILQPVSNPHDQVIQTDSQPVNHGQSHPEPTILTPESASKIIHERNHPIH